MRKCRYYEQLEAVNRNIVFQKVRVINLTQGGLKAIEVEEQMLNAQYFYDKVKEYVVGKIRDGENIC